MTVEASYVMAIVIFTLAVLIRTAYFQYRKTGEVMGLHCVVEQLRCREEEQAKILPHGQAERSGSQVEGYIDGGTWKKEITAGVHEPEGFLRKIGIFEKGEVQEE